MDLGEFWSGVTCLVHAFNGRVTSGPRSPAANAAVGGVADSMHITGLAADVVLGDWNNKQAFVRLASRLGIAIVDETAQKNHLHLQPVSANAPAQKVG